MAAYDFAGKVVLMTGGKSGIGGTTAIAGGGGRRACRGFRPPAGRRARDRKARRACRRRRETEALLIGLAVIPLRRIDYKGHWPTELDLDAVLARPPKLVLVDELAHTNARGSRHPKRYIDVVELLEAGIDVHTTLNIQRREPERYRRADHPRRA